MKACVESDDNGKFRIRLDVCDVVYSPWTSNRNIAVAHWGGIMMFAFGGIIGAWKYSSAALEFEPGKVYRVTAVEVIPIEHENATH